jgi:hypothetical protein
MVERGESCLSDLYVVLRGAEARADTADHLAIDHDGQAAVHFDIAVRRNRCDAAMTSMSECRRDRSALKATVICNNGFAVLALIASMLRRSRSERSFRIDGILQCLASRPL